MRTWVLGSKGTENLLKESPVTAQSGCPSIPVVIDAVFDGSQRRIGPLGLDQVVFAQLVQGKINGPVGVDGSF